MKEKKASLTSQLRVTYWFCCTWLWREACVPAEDRHSSLPQADPVLSPWRPRDTEEERGRRPNLRFLSRWWSFRRAPPYIPQRAAESWPWKCSEQRRAQQHRKRWTLSRTEPEPCQSAAPLFSSWLQVAALGFALTVGLEAAQVWVGLTLRSWWVSVHKEVQQQSNLQMEKKCKTLKKRKMDCKTTIKFFLLHFPGQGRAEIILLTTVCLQQMCFQFVQPCSHLVKLQPSDFVKILANWN